MKYQKRMHAWRQQKMEIAGEIMTLLVKMKKISTRIDYGKN